jgi:4-aminobutyrate aminotransferase-like enzyme
MGNGHPIGAVVTRREIIETFFVRDRYFNTFAGNPVSAEAGNAVLDVMEGEHLQANAKATGRALRRSLEALAQEHPIIGDIRGNGFLLGVELVRNRTTREPAGEEARFILNELCRRGILVGLTGPNRKARNILKVRPPMVFNDEHVQLFSRTLDQTLRHLRQHRA